MDLRLTAEQEAFRQQVRAFFRSEYPQDLLAKVRANVTLTRDDHVRSQKALENKGWLGVSWPVECGGTGWSEVERYLFEQELEYADAPNIVPMSIRFIGPIICAFGSEAQKTRWLPDILASRAMWAQGYSEPESGSDLASLRMSATLDGGEYVLNGTKIWTSAAQWADWIFCLVRTSKEERKQSGISLICVPMSSPGVSVHPIITIDGAHTLNRVEFESVHVPIANRIGEEGYGWKYATVLLEAERLSLCHIGRKQMQLARIRACAANTPGETGQMMIDDPLFSHELAACELAVAVLEVSVLRGLSTPMSAAAISALKIASTEMAQRISELGLELAGRSRQARIPRTQIDWADAYPETLAQAAPAASLYLADRAQTIYGGTTEIQKNIIWRHLQSSD
jgi:alkylation response protein AidB-like acyl-CoA dehydrogenase